MFTDFLAFLVGDYEAEPPHHDTDGQNLEWGFHIDINSIFLTFPDFLMNFKISWPISKFTDFFLTF